MLYDVAALLVTSASLQQVAEASVAPVNSSAMTAVVHTLATNPRSILPQADLTPPVLTSPVVTAPVLTTPISSFSLSIFPTSAFAISAFSDTELNVMSGGTLLQGLMALPQSRIESYVSAHPEQIDALLAAPPSASEVNTLWNSVPASTQQSALAGAPRLFGNLNGIPAASRNVAVTDFMAESRASLSAAASTQSGRALAESARRQLHMLDAVTAAVKTPKGDPTRSMLSVDLTGQGKAAIVVGNLATADYVTYMVPGMFFKVDGQMDDWANDATDLYKQQQAWLKQFGVHNTVAVVAWMGYQTPDLTNIGSLDLAYQGRDALTGAIEGMLAERADDPPYTTIVAHSYGSTAALMALTEKDFSVDALALVGSPGSAAQSVSDLHVRNGNVYVGAAAWDPVPNSAWFGSDPASPSYGAMPMGVGGETDPVTGAQLGQSTGHNEYFAPGSESMRNMALIGIDMGWLVDG